MPRLGCCAGLGFWISSFCCASICRRYSTLAAASSGGRSARAISSASAKRPCRPTTSARFWRARGSDARLRGGLPQRGFRLLQILRQRIGQTEVGQHRRLVRHDLQRGGIIAPRFFITAKLVEHCSLRRKDAPVRHVGGVRAGKYLERLIVVADLRERAAIGAEQRLIVRILDRGLFQHRHRLRALPGGAQSLRIVHRVDDVIGMGAVERLRIFPARCAIPPRWSGRGAAASDPVVSGPLVVLQPARPAARNAASAVEVSRREGPKGADRMAIGSWLGAHPAAPTGPQQ